MSLFYLNDYPPATVSIDSRTLVLSTTSGGADYSLKGTPVAGGTSPIQMQTRTDLDATYLDACYVTPPLNAVTISGSIQVAASAYEEAMTLNLGLHAKIYKYSGGVLTLIGEGSDGVELGTSSTVMTWNITPTSTALADGDRLVVRFYIVAAGGTMATGGVAWITALSSSTYVNFTETITIATGTTHNGVASATGVGGLSVALANTATMSGSSAIQVTVYDPTAAHGEAYFPWGTPRVVSDTVYGTGIEKLRFSNETVSALSAQLNVPRVYSASGASQVHGYVVGGQTYGTISTSAIEKLSFADESLSTSSATSGSSPVSGAYSESAIYIAYLSSTSVDKIATATDTKTTLSGRFSVAPTNSFQAIQSSNNGYFPITGTDLGRINFDTDTGSTCAAALPQGSAPQGAASISSVGVWTDFYGVVAHVFDFATETASAISCTVGKSVGIGSSSNGYFYADTTYKYAFETGAFSSIAATFSQPHYGSGAFNSILKNNRAGALGRGLLAAYPIRPTHDGRAYIASGYKNFSYTNDYNDRIDFASQSATTSTVGLSTPRTFSSGVSCAVTARAYAVGGSTTGSSGTTTIDGVSTAAEYKFAVSSQLSVNRYAGCSMQSQTKGYVAGGASSLTSTATLAYANETAGTLGASLSELVDFGAGVSSSDRGFFAGNGQTTLHKLVFATEALSAAAGALQIGRNNVAAASSHVAGYFAGGAVDGFAVSSCTSIDYQLETAATTSDSLAVARYMAAGASGQSIGAICGGSQNASTLSAAIDGINFFSGAMSAWAATLSQSRPGAVGLSAGAYGYNTSWQIGRGRAVTVAAQYFGGGVGYFTGVNSGDSYSVGSRSTDKLDFSSGAVTTIAALHILSSYTALRAASPGRFGFFYHASAARTKLDTITEAETALGNTTVYQTGASIWNSSAGWHMGLATASTFGYKHTFLTDAVTSSSAWLQTARSAPAGLSSSANGYVLGGQSGVVSIEKMPFSTEVTATISATVTHITQNSASSFTTDTGYTYGGPSSANINTFAFSTEVAGVNGSALPGSSQYGAAATNYDTAYIARAYTGSAESTAIYTLAYATGTTGTSSASLNFSRNMAQAVYERGGVHGHVPALAGTATLSASASVLDGMRASMASTGTASASGTRLEGTVAATLGGHGTVLAEVSALQLGASSLQGYGELSAAAGIDRNAAAIAGGSGTVSATGRRIVYGGQTVAGASGMVAAVYLARNGAASASGSGQMQARARAQLPAPDYENTPTIHVRSDQTFVTVESREAKAWVIQ